MYHYVRDVERTPFPGIKARLPAEFHGQLDHVERTYTAVSCAEVHAAYREGAALPENAILLTFDDGLTDHRDVVAPELLRRGLPGCFCVPASTVLARTLLDVHKLQFLLAVSPDHDALAARVLALVDRLRSDQEIPPSERLRAAYARPNRFDPPETVLIKRLLQDGLPDPVRQIVLDELFGELVTTDELAFAEALYLSLEDVRRLADQGFDVAGHGDRHRRLGLLPEGEQRVEIERTVAFLASVLGSAPARWTMSYPYGSRCATTLRLLEEAHCGLAFTVEPELAGPEEHPLELPRLDTNDLPLAAASTR